MVIYNPGMNFQLREFLGNDMALPPSPPGFTLQKKIGEGAFGKVYLAKKTSGEIRALKAFEVGTSGTSGELKRSWDREIHILVRASNHRNVVSFYGSFSTTGTLWLEMEYCAGGSLHTYYHANGISRSLKRQFMIEIAKAVDFLHANTIIHRDLKPDNVLIQLDGARDPYAKLGDFGLAKSIANVSYDGALQNYYLASRCYTSYYKAPEINDEHYTYKADIFSMGVLFMTLIRETTVDGYMTNCAVDTNKVVWPAGNYMHMTKKQLVMNANAVVGPSLRDLVNSMILLDYHRRPTARKVYTSLQSAISAGDFDDNPRSRGSGYVAPP